MRALNAREVETENLRRRFDASLHGRQIETNEPIPETSEESDIDKAQQAAIDAHLKARQEEKIREMQLHGG